MLMTKRRVTQTLEKIVRRAVLLEYDDHVLKRSWELGIARLLGLGRQWSRAS